MDLGLFRKRLVLVGMSLLSLRYWGVEEVSSVPDELDSVFGQNAISPRVHLFKAYAGLPFVFVICELDADSLTDV